jgi:hypothetical protein
MRVPQNSRLTSNSRIVALGAARIARNVRLTGMTVKGFPESGTLSPPRRGMQLAEVRALNAGSTVSRILRLRRRQSRQDNAAWTS